MVKCILQCKVGDYLFLGWSVGRSVGLSVTNSFDDPHGAPFWPSWPRQIMRDRGFPYYFGNSVKKKEASKSASKTSIEKKSIKKTHRKKKMGDWASK